MAVSVLDNFDYAGKKPNFARDLFDSIEEMVAYSENYLPEVFEANVRSTGKRYRYNVNNPDIEGLGRWREVSSGSSGASSYTELEDKPKINDVELSGDNSLEDLGIVQSDWAEEDETSHGYIKNKPSLSKVKSISVNDEEVEPDESGNVNINVDSGLPTPESKDKLLLSVENEETSELEWSQIDKSEVGGTTQFIGTQEEWDNLTLEEKAKYDGKEVIFTNDGKVKSDSDKKIVICIGDSYNKNTDMWVGWGECLKTVNPNLKVYSYEAGGGGFVANTYEYDFLGALQNHSQDEAVPEDDKKSVTDIVVLGGYNDCSVQATQAQITNKVKEFVDYCKSNYPNAKITIGSISFDYNSAENQGRLFTYKTYYKIAANLCGVSFYENFSYILRNTNKIYFSDSNPNSGFHPNTKGNTAVAEYLNEYLYNGGFNVKDGCLQCGAFVYSFNGNICISPTPPQGDTPEQNFMDPLLAGKTIPFNIWTDIGETKNAAGENLLWGAIPSATAYWSVNVLKQMSGTELGFVTILTCKLENKHIYVKNVANVNSITFDGSIFLDASSKNYYFDSQLIY